MSNKIQINQKLMEREDRLVEVFDLERQINAILGGDPYPLVPPDSLPSRQKRKKPKRKAAPKKPAPIRLRKLDPENETAYRIVYIDHDVEKIEIHTDSRPLALLINTPLPHIELLCIETVQAAPESQWTAIDLLFGSPKDIEKPQDDRSENAD